MYGLRPHLGQLFNPGALALSFDLSYCFPTLLAHALNIPLYILALAHIVEKANKCLDFTVTTFFLHLLATWVHCGRFPWALSWWLWHAILTTVTVVTGELLCMKLETAEIKLDFGHIISKGTEIGIQKAKKMLAAKKPPKLRAKGEKAADV